MNILGFNFGHDSSACVIVDGEIKAAIAEERLTRSKNDASFPINAIRWCLDWCGLKDSEIDIVASAGGTFRLDSRHFFELPPGFESGLPALKSSLKRKVRDNFFAGMGSIDHSLPLYCEKIKLRPDCRVVTVEHHLAHAASAYFTAGFGDKKSLVVTMDGLGDHTSCALWRGEKNRLVPIRAYDRSSSIGWFYGNATEGLGWRHGSDEWKVMGLAPYGKPQPGALKGFHPEFAEGKLVKPHDYGTFGIWRDHGSTHFHGKDAAALGKIAEKLGREDFSAEVQRTVEEQMLAFILPALREENTRLLACSGGCFLNVKFNQRLWYSGAVDEQWIYPDPGDAGLSVGAALQVYYEARPTEHNHRLTHLYWGPEFSDPEIETILKERGLVYEKPEDLSGRVADLLVKNYAIGWFQGRMEAGPRALGGRSILMSPLVAENKDRINAKVKYRESFRPFCPSILAEYRDTYLKNARDERFMISSFEASEAKAPSIPAVVHVDGTVRPQLVYRETNPRYHALIKAFGDRTGEYAILNTSFNVKGEPIVCHPREAIKCFFDTGLEALALGSFMVLKPDKYGNEI
jgi:carbamoyltransferase